MPSRAILAVLLAAAAWNAATWAVYRIDKARAARAARRIPERVLLAMAAAGGSAGALAAMYGHRRRHKTRKLSFALPLWLIAAAHAALLAWLAWR